MHLFCLTPSCGTSFSVRPHVQTLKVPQVTVSPSGQAVKTQHKLIKQTRGQSAEGDRGCRRGGWRGRREAGGEEGAFPITPSHPAPHGSRAAGDTDPLHTALWCLQTQARQVPRESAAAGPHGAPTAPICLPRAGPPHQRTVGSMVRADGIFPGLPSLLHTCVELLA